MSTLQSLRLDLRKVYEYPDRQQPKCEFYYVTRDTADRFVRKGNSFEPAIRRKELLSASNLPSSRKAR